MTSSPPKFARTWMPLSMKLDGKEAFPGKHEIERERERAKVTWQLKNLHFISVKVTGDTQIISIKSECLSGLI